MTLPTILVEKIREGARKAGVIRECCKVEEAFQARGTHVNVTKYGKVWLARELCAVPQDLEWGWGVGREPGRSGR